MKLILILHASTDWNMPDSGRLQGQTDVPLNDFGKEEAANIGAKLSGDKVSVSRIISSDLRRARETAIIISGALKISISFDPRLRECSFGSLEGAKKSDLDVLYKPEITEILGCWHGSYRNYDFHNFGGEN